MEQLSAIIDSSDDAIFAKSLDGIITSWNHGAELLYGYKPDEIIGMPVSILLPSDRTNEIKDILKQIAAGKRIDHFETKRVIKGGHIVDISLTVSPVKDEGGKIIGASSIARDISAQKRLDEILKQTMDELKASNRELEQFAYVASHDLQEPLRLVASYVQLLEQRYQSLFDEQARKYMDYIVSGAKRMQTLINDLLACSRVGTMGKELKPVSASKALEYALGNLEMSISQSGGKVTSKQLPTVMGDGVQLTQLFQNLIGNAIKFHSEKPAQVEIAADDAGMSWQFSIKDNGIGIDMKYADRIFTIFQRLHERSKYKGTGIGLAIAKRIVERHHGQIWFESEPGKGTTFFFTLPKVKE